eukprot:scaffold502_cov115-Isochrysis_galbana.AAC.8
MTTDKQWRQSGSPGRQNTCRSRSWSPMIDQSLSAEWIGHERVHRICLATPACTSGCTLIRWQQKLGDGRFSSTNCPEPRVTIKAIEM